MARKTRSKTPAQITDTRHDATRLNNPPASLAGDAPVPLAPKMVYEYSPRRTPQLQFDCDARLENLLEKAAREPLSGDEVAELRRLYDAHEPWLEWAGKREKPRLEVEPVALHIHERVAAQAIIEAAQRQSVQRSLFAEPNWDYDQQTAFYQHEMDWTNRLILGDSLQVMSSLAGRENLAGRVQMVYLDPPYGIKFASNFQPKIGQRDVKDRDDDLSREPETVRAYRDTWQLGIHSYLTYLRDRLNLVKAILHDSGSVFVQISDENLHRVRALMDEVFGPENFVVTICFKKKAYQDAGALASVNDYLIWFAKDKSKLKYQSLYAENVFTGEVGKYTSLQSASGQTESALGRSEEEIASLIEKDWRLMRDDYPIVSQDPPRQPQPFVFQNHTYEPTQGRHWSQQYPSGLDRLALAERLRGTGNRLYAVVYWDDGSKVPMSNFWDKLKGAANPLYAVQTTESVIERCILMTTDPGDLVIDPTCGSGTTAMVAEQWGRRWITCDTSRVALSIARQRLLTARFDQYRLQDESAGVKGGFVCKTVPHITLKSIAQNAQLDPIFDQYQPLLDSALQAANDALQVLAPDTRRALKDKLTRKEKESKRSVSEADRRRWDLPICSPNAAASTCSGFEHWTMPFDSDELYPQVLADAVTEYRRVWRAKMDAVNNCIAANAESETLVDKPEIVSNVVRVSGPFTVESVQPPEMSLGEATIPAMDAEFEGEPDEMPVVGSARSAAHASHGNQ